MKHKLAAAGLVAGLLGGAAAGVALGVPGLAGAQSDATTTTTAPATTAPSTTDGSTDDDAANDDAGTDDGAKRSAWMADALAPLVEAGTITQAQADAVLAALQEAKPERGHGRGGLRGVVHLGIETAADALGVTNEELRTALRDGKSIADVAGEEGVDVQTVIDAMVAEAEDQIADAVTDGRITQAQADERLATLTDDVTKVVNGERPAFGPGRGGRGGPGRGADESPTTTAEPSS